MEEIPPSGIAIEGSFADPEEDRQPMLAVRRLPVEIFDDMAEIIRDVQGRTSLIIFFDVYEYEGATIGDFKIINASSHRTLPKESAMVLNSFLTAVSERVRTILKEPKKKEFDSSQDGLSSSQMVALVDIPIPDSRTKVDGKLLRPKEIRFARSVIHHFVTEMKLFLEQNGVYRRISLSGGTPSSPTELKISFIPEKEARVIGLLQKFLDFYTKTHPGSVYKFEFVLRDDGGKGYVLKYTHRNNVS